MYSYIFKEKLRKLNPSLYLKEDNAVARTNDVRASGIYSRVTRRVDAKSNYHQLDSDAQKFLFAHESGNADKFVTGCPTGWIPEYDNIDVESGRILQKGWRTIVLYLVKERLCSLERAQKVFTSSLGTTDWDKWGYDRRLYELRQDAGWKSARNILKDMF